MMNLIFPVISVTQTFENDDYNDEYIDEDIVCNDAKGNETKADVSMKQKFSFK